MNLPTKITFVNNQMITYIYNALGQKVKKTVAGKVTDYLGGFQYENNVLQFLPNPEGYYDALQNRYVYNYTDHLGNVRLSYTKVNNVFTVVDESNYYPFGLKHTGESAINYAGSYKYKYNGKELQDELGLNMYDLGARHFMPDIGRFAVMDPMTDFVNYQSPYVVSDNNPVLNVDEYGLGIINFLGNLFSRIGNAIASLFTGGGCSCKQPKSLSESWREEDFPKINQFIRNVGGYISDFFKDNSSPTPTSTGDDEEEPIVGIAMLNSEGITMSGRSSIQLPKINITPRNTSNDSNKPKKLNTNNSISINVRFEAGSSTLRSDPYYKEINDKTLNDLLKTLKEYPEIMLVIKGNVSNTNYPNMNRFSEINGSDRTVGALQLSRAIAIKRFLVKNGINQKRLIAKRGEIAPYTASATGEFK